MNQKAFTLIEILASISIVIFLTAFVLLNYRVGQDQHALSRAAHKLVQDLRTTQEMAMSMSAEYCGGSPKGYGVHFKQSWPDYYILFAECDGNKQYNSGIDNIVEQIYLEKGIIISGLSPASDLDICFTPPNPTTWITSGQQATIILSIKDSPLETKTVKVNSIGLIETE